MLRHAHAADTVVILLASLAFALTALPARADITFTPQRIIFEGKDRSATVHMINTGRERRAYDLSWAQQRMRPDGALQTTEEMAGAASTLVVLSPRRVVLEPGANQTVRLGLRRPPNLPVGEYRSHLQLTPVVQEDSSEGANARGLGARLRVRLSFSMPVIVRHGSGETAVSVHAQKLDLENGALMVRLDRQGPFSTFGDLYAFWRPNAATELAPIGRLEGVAVYAELATREASVPLYDNARSKLSGGEVFVYYVDPADNRAVLAETGARL